MVNVTKITERLGIAPPPFECPEIGQTPAELLIELEAVCLLQPRTIVEIGSASGGHIHLLSAVLDGNKHTIISIDPWEDGTKYREQFIHYQDCIRQLSEQYPSISIDWIQGRSQSSSVANDLQKMVGSNGIDYLFVDGSHEEKDVLQDWQNYRHLVNTGGLICFHDVVGYPGVEEAWKKISGELGPEYSTRIVNRRGVPLLKTANEPVELGLGYIFHRGLSEQVKNILEKEGTSL